MAGIDVEFQEMREAWDAMKARGIGLLTEWTGPQSFTHKGVKYWFEPKINGSDGRYHLHGWTEHSPEWRRVVEQGETKPI